MNKIRSAIGVKANIDRTRVDANDPKRSSGIDGLGPSAHSDTSQIMLQ